MDANGSEVAKVRADRGQCHFNSAPGRRVEPASKTGPRLVAPLGARWRPLVTFTLLAPHIVAAVLSGRQPPELNARKLMDDRAGLCFCAR